VLLAFGFSGYLLPWNQLAYFATKVGTDIAGSVPVVGEWTLRFLRAEITSAAATLSRFYGWHVAILPAVAAVLLAFHLVQVQVQGMSVPRASRPGAACASSPTSCCATSSAGSWRWASSRRSRPLPLGARREGDPFAPAYADIRPEWYFVFMFQTLKLVPGGAILGVEYEALAILAFGRRRAALARALPRPGAGRARRPRDERPRRRRAGLHGGDDGVGLSLVDPVYAVLGTVAVLAVLGVGTHGGRRDARR